MRKYLLTVLTYFGYFLYAPSLDEIHTFFPKGISKENLQLLLLEEVKRGKILRLSNNMSSGLFQSSTNHQPLITNHSVYTLPQYSTQSNKKSKFESQIKAKRIAWTIQVYLSILKILPLIKFVGVTGASAMRGLRENDDIDLCIVTKRYLLWTTRFFAVTIAKILGIHNKTGVCLNLFFDESDLAIPKNKHNLYIGHELLQMKPIIDKDCVYASFLGENKWIYTYFPNAKQPVILGKRPPALTPGSRFWMRSQFSLTRMTMWQPLELFLKHIQLPIIQHNHANFSITDTQLWLFKNDFEKKLKRRGLVK